MSVAPPASDAEGVEAALLLLDEALATAASLAAVEEGSVEDLAREAYEELVEEFEVVLKPEREEVRGG